MFAVTVGYQCPQYVVGDILTCPKAPDPIPSIFAHLIMGRFGREVCIRVWGIVGTAVSTSSEPVRANLGFCANFFTSRCSTLFRVAGALYGQSSWNVMRSRLTPPTACFSESESAVPSMFEAAIVPCEFGASTQNRSRSPVIAGPVSGNERKRRAEEEENRLTANHSVEVWLHNNFPWLSRPKRHGVRTKD